MSLDDLKAEKKALQKKLHRFETEFCNANGRRVQVLQPLSVTLKMSYLFSFSLSYFHQTTEDRAPMSVHYKRYKYLKKLLDVEAKSTRPTALTTLNNTL